MLVVGALAGLAALSLDVRAAAALIILPVVAGALLFLLAWPLAWAPILIALSLLVPPLPFSIGETPLPLHPAALVFAAALVVGWVRLPEWNIERNSLALACGVFLAALLISLPLAWLYSGAAAGAQSTIRWLLLSVGFLVLAWTAWGPGSHEQHAAPLVKLLLAAAFLSSVFAVADFFYQFPATVRFSEQYVYLPDGPRRRAQGVFYDASALGNFCAMMLALILALGREARERLRVPRWLLWLPVPPLAVALLLSFSRGSIVNLAVSLLVLAWLRRRSLWNARAALAGVALAAIAALSIGVVAPEMAARYGQRLEFTAARMFDNPNEVLSMRLDSWSYLAQFLRDNPHHLLLGIGYKTLPYTDYLGRPLAADNMYLSLLVETGLPGLLALLLLCGAILVHTLRLHRHREPAVAALGAFLFAFWCGEMVQMLSGDILTYWRVTPAYFALLGVTLRRSAAL